MISLDEKRIQQAVDDFGDIADNLDDTVSQSSSDSIYRDIEQEVDKAIVNPVLQRARELGEPHVGDRVSEIEPVPGQWRGDTYVAGLRSTNEVVLSHEYGSGRYGTSGPYQINPTSKDALSFVVDGRPIVVDYVVHPGVRGKRFMHQAIRERADDIAENALEEMQQTFDEAFDT